MTKADLHKLVDAIPDARVESIAVLIQRVVDDPEVERLLGIPWDDEPLTDEEIAAHRAGLEAIERGEGIEWEEAKRRLRAAG